MNSWNGQVALVTGASRGIGKVLAQRLAERGAEVFLAARSRDHLESVAKTICEAGGKAHAVVVDLTSEAGIVDMFAHIDQLCGRLDVCINNAALGVFGAIAESGADDLDAMYATNVRAPFLCCRESLRIMRRRQCGTIINIGSVVSIKGYVNQGGYTSTKHALMGLTKTLAAEAQPDGIRVSIILPGGVDTEMVRESRPDLDPAELLAPDDVFQAVEYLLSLSPRAAVDQIVLRRRHSTPF